jgi:hypothetical protein
MGTDVTGKRDDEDGVVRGCGRRRQGSAEENETSVVEETNARNVEIEENLVGLMRECGGDKLGLRGGKSTNVGRENGCAWRGTCRDRGI